MFNRMTKTSILLEYMLALDIILGSNSIYASFSFSKYVTLALGLLAAGLVFLRFMIEASGGNRVRINSNSLMALFIFLFVVVFYLFAQNVFWAKNFGQLANYLGLFVLFTPALWLYVGVFGYRGLLDKYVKLMVMIAVVALLFWGLGSIMGLFAPTSYFTIGWGGNNQVASYYGVYFETQFKTIAGHVVVRNSAIWPEAPMYTMSLMFALLTQLFVLPKRRPVFVTILIISMASTLTSTAILILVGLATYYLWRATNVFSPWYRLVLVLMVLLVVSVPAMFVFSKFMNSKLNGFSGSVRVDDYITGVKAWIKHPIIGEGFNNNKALYKFMNMNIREYYNNGELTFNKGVANAWTPLIANGGLLFMGTYLVGLGSLFRLGGSWRVLTLFIFAMMFLSIMQYTTIMMLFIFAVPFALENDSDKERFVRNRLWDSGPKNFMAKSSREYGRG